MPVRKINVIVIMLLITWSTLAQESTLPAFPGAEGHGRYVTGGRGGRVIYVTRLEDDAAKGSLRYAINQSGNRIVLFQVSGTIQLKSALNISRGNLTIAGQTAPGDGICLRDYPVQIQADNVIIRYLRFRMGDETGQENDALWGRNHKNIIIDHCSISWSTDECASFYDNENFTLQWSLLSESLRNSVHDKGKHGYGGIWGGRKASFHHNLLASHDSRNPRFCGSRYSNQPAAEQVDFRNNVIYNWGGNSSYGAEGGTYNLVGNYYKAGPATASSKSMRLLEPYADNGSNNQAVGTYGQFYLTDNLMTASAAVTVNNWQGVSIHSSFSSYAPTVSQDDLKLADPIPAGQVTTHPAEVAYEKVLEHVGASLVRDTIDRRIVHDTRTGTATYKDGGNGSVNGIIDTQSAVGGWPELKSTEAPLDTDGDGMPDSWETANRLNPNSANDAQQKTVDGQYPNLEVYLNSLVAHITQNQNEEGVVTSNTALKQKQQPIRTYYNPLTQELTIQHTRIIDQIWIYTSTGALVLANKQGKQKDVCLSLPDLQTGIYIVRIQDENNQLLSSKIRIF